MSDVDAARVNEEERLAEMEDAAKEQGEIDEDGEVRNFSDLYQVYISTNTSTFLFQCSDPLFFSSDEEDTTSKDDDKKVKPRGPYAKFKTMKNHVVVPGGKDVSLILLLLVLCILTTTIDFCG